MTVLGIKCGLAWFGTVSGLCSLVVSVVLALAGAFFANKWDHHEEKRKHGWYD